AKCRETHPRERPIRSGPGCIRLKILNCVLCLAAIAKHGLQISPTTYFGCNTLVELVAERPNEAPEAKLACRVTVPIKDVGCVQPLGSLRIESKNTGNRLPPAYQ